MKIILFKLINRIYLGDALFGYNTFILSNFLTDDVGPYGESFVRFIEDTSDEETIRNYSCVMKEDGDVLIGCQFDRDPYANCIRMSQKKFLSMLGQWGKPIREKPQEIMVFKEGESYRLEGHGFPDKQ